MVSQFCYFENAPGFDKRIKVEYCTTPLRSGISYSSSIQRYLKMQRGSMLMSNNSWILDITTDFIIGYTSLGDLLKWNYVTSLAEKRMVPVSSVDLIYTTYFWIINDTLRAGYLAPSLHLHNLVRAEISRKWIMNDFTD